MGLRRRPTGTTRLAAVIGCPVRHSLSPAIHEAAFAAAGLDWTYLAFEVQPGAAPGAVAGARALGIAGLSVTMPHKAAVAACVDHLTDAAAALGAVNCVWWDGPGLVGDNTDGAGFLASLAECGVVVDGADVVVLGAGGAARAVVSAMAGAGADRIGVWNRTAQRAAEAAEMAGPVGGACELNQVCDADVVVNATPLGMGDSASSPVPAGWVGAGQVAVDLVYRPAATPFLRDAAAAGAYTVGGIGMLVHQAALAFTRWTGEPAPLDAMREVAEAPA